MKREFQLADRREFLADTLRTVALFGAFASGSSQAGENPGRSATLAEDLLRYGKTDPKLVAYEQVARWKSPDPEPRRIAVGPDDRIYICAGRQVTRFERDGTAQPSLALPSPGHCVAVADDGTLFVGLRDHIVVFDACGQRRATWDTLGKRSWLTALAAGKSDIFAADSGHRTILRYDRSGKLVARLGEKDSERSIPGFVVPSPHLDVKIARDGLLRVNNLGRHRVEAYTFQGDFEGSWGNPSAAWHGFCGCCNPIGLALLPDGRFVTCEKGLPRVKVSSDQGEFESVVAGPESFPENARACSSLNDCTHGGMDAAVDSQGRIYILDFVAADIRVMKRKASA